MNQPRFLKVSVLIVTLACLAIFQPAYAASTTFTVNTNADNTTNDGLCTLREAILAADGTPANSDCGADNGKPYTIAFNIGGGGVQTIVPDSSLPAITRAVTIDGWTQPGCSADPCIELNGASAGAGANGLTISAGSSTVKGLVVNRFSGNGITVETLGGNVIQGNFIGTNITGTLGLGNKSDGVYLCCGAGNNTIGGTTASERNLISNNSHYGVQIDQSSSGNRVEDNYIGTAIDGITPLGNHYDGVIVARFGGTPSNNNTIGRMPNGSGNSNTIAFNNGNGITIGVDNSDPGSGNAILGNSIFANGCLGIDLSDTHTGCSRGISVTTNHLNCNATGPNNYQNYPVLTSAMYGGGSTIIAGTLNCKPNTTYALEFFASVDAGYAGFGQGQTFLGTLKVTTDAFDNASFAAHFATTNTLGQFVSATATNPNGDTSEFALDVKVLSGFQVFLPFILH